MRYLIGILLFISFNSYGQGRSSFGASRAQDTSFTNAQVVLPLLKNPGAKVLATDGAGKVILVNPGASSFIAGNGIVINEDTLLVDSGKVATLFAVYDTANNIKAWVNGLFTQYYKASHIDSVISNYYDKATSDARYSQPADINDSLQRVDVALAAHINDISNPHNVTLNQAAQVGNSIDTDITIGAYNNAGIVVAVGNSITADIYTNPAPLPYFRYVSYWNDLTPIAHAHGGATYYRGYTPHNNNGGLMDSFSVLENMPTDNSTLIIELGFNDACQYATSFDTTQMMATLDSFVTGAIATKSWKANRIIALSTWYIPSVSVCSNMTYAMLTNINTAIRNKCAQLGIHYGDIYSEFVNRQQSNIWWTDNVHWWDMGHLIAANVIQKEMYGKLAVNGSISASSYYDNNGNEIVNTDSTGAKIIRGKTGFDAKASNRALVTIPYTKYYAGLKAGEITFQALSPYNYIQGYNLYHDGTTYRFDTAGYAGMGQFAQGEYSWWQSTNSGNAGDAPTLEKRMKFSYINRQCGFGGNPGNAGANDFSGSAIVTNSNTIYLNFTTKFKYAPTNTSGIYSLLVQNTADTNTQTINSLPYSFIANRLKYSGGTTFYVPVFSGSDSLVASDIRDSSNHIGISQNPLSYSRFAIPYSDSMLSAKIGYWNIGSISSSNMYISNNSYFKRGTGTVCIDTAYDMHLGLYNSRSTGGACFLIGGTPYLQNGGQVRVADYAYFKVTNWGTTGIGAHASAANNDTAGCSIIVTNTTGDPSTKDSIFLPNVAALGAGNSKVYVVLDNSGARGRIPNNKIAYLSAIPQSDITNLSSDSTFVRNDSLIEKKNGTEKFRYKFTAGGGGATDTTSLSNRINLKKNIADSVSGSDYVTHHQLDTAEARINAAIAAVSGGYDSTKMAPLYRLDTTRTRINTDLATKANTSALGAAAFSNSYNDLSDLPTLFDGDYNSLTNQPTRIDSAGYADTAKSALNAGQLSGQLASYYLDRANHTGTQSWSTITSTPTTLSGYGITDAAPLSHTHGMSDLTGFNISTPSNGDLLKYDNATSKWINFTPSYITGNQSITLSGDVSGVGTTAITTTIGAGKVTNAMLAGSIAASKFVGTDIATVGTITSGTWNGTIISPTYGGTGVNNGTKTITLGGNLTTSGAFNTTLTATATTSVTLPTSGTLATLAGSETLTNKTLTTPVIASITNTGTMTLPTVTGTLVQYAESATTSSATPAPTGDARQNYYDLTALATAPTFASPSGTPANHNLLTIRIKDNGTARALTWNAIYRAGTTVALPTTTTISKTMHVQFEYNSADSKWDLVGVVDGF